MAASPEPLSRRRSLGLLLASGSSLLLGGCALNRWSTAVGEATQPLNERIEALLQGKGPVPEFRRSQVEPEALLVNSFNGTPTFAPGRYRLAVNGAVRRPLRLVGPAPGRCAGPGRPLTPGGLSGDPLRRPVR